MLAEIVIALWRLYLASSFAAPSSLKLTKLANEISFPLVSERTNIFEIPSLFLLSDKYCCTTIGYSLPSLLNVVIFLPPYRVSKVSPIDLLEIPKSLALFLLINIFTSGLFLF